MLGNHALKQVRSIDILIMVSSAFGRPLMVGERCWYVDISILSLCPMFMPLSHPLLLKFL